MHALGLTDDRVFIMQILPLTLGGLLQFLGACLCKGSSWVVCKCRLLDEYFPHFVWERLIQDLIVFNFQDEGQSMHVYIEQVFQAADFLQYEAMEQQLVDRVVMNFHPNILSQVAFLDRPWSLKELHRVAGLMEEKFSILKERWQLDQGVPTGGDRGASPRGMARDARPRPEVPGAASAKCWGCGQFRYFRRGCPQKNALSGNVQWPGGRSALGKVPKQPSKNCCHPHQLAVVGDVAAESG
jgi:hypothetical protein